MPALPNMLRSHGGQVRPHTPYRSSECLKQMAAPWTLTSIQRVTKLLRLQCHSPASCFNDDLGCAPSMGHGAVGSADQQAAPLLGDVSVYQ